jgi:hypothetical protein
VFSSIKYINFQQPKGYDLAVYPFFNNNTESELFFYNVQILYQDGEKVILATREDVEAYYADFYINGFCYTVVSRDNELTITEPQELKNMTDILSSIDIADYTYVSTGQSNYDGSVICGYIVRSKIDNTLHFLEWR